MRTLRSALVLFWLAAVGISQVGYQWLKVDGATATAVGVLWAHGFDDDEAAVAGLARVLTTCRLERARRAVPKLIASGLHVGGDYALAFGVVAAGDTERAAAFVAALLADEAADVAPHVLTDDVIALAVARAALEADDAEFVYPGDILMSRARERLGNGTSLARPPAGIARAMAKLTPDAVRAALLAPVAVRIAGLGVIDAVVIDAITKLPPKAMATAVRPASTCQQPRILRGITEDENSRADSPYVSVAFALPAAVDRAALALGVEVATSRAFRRWKLRGMEQQARAPFVKWSWLYGDAILQFCRRGEEPEQLLPGQQPGASLRDELKATTEELRAFLIDLRTVPPTEQELGGARVALRSLLLLPGPGEQHAWASEPATLPGRLQVLLLAAHHGVDVALLNSCDAKQVHTVLNSVLAEDRGSWHALLPAPATIKGYRRR